ncbi:hypothetical protein M0R45_019091 [Rubus argutus]|uniref:Uncharacterized protein n=1 Tax=Rubus argutus TaxID=59490 RepID=A0AAW1X4F5_RUBAR
MELGLECCQESPDERIDIKSVVIKLNKTKLALVHDENHSAFPSDRATHPLGSVKDLRWYLVVVFVKRPWRPTGSQNGRRCFECDAGGAAFLVVSQ